MKWTCIRCESRPVCADYEAWHMRLCEKCYTEQKRVEPRKAKGRMKTWHENLTDEEKDQWVERAKLMMGIRAIRDNWTPQGRHYEFQDAPEPCPRCGAKIYTAPGFILLCSKVILKDCIVQEHGCHYAYTLDPE